MGKFWEDIDGMLSEKIAPLEKKVSQQFVSGIFRDFDEPDTDDQAAWFMAWAKWSTGLCISTMRFIMAIQMEMLDSEKIPRDFDKTFVAQSMSDFLQKFLPNNLTEFACCCLEKSVIELMSPEELQEKEGDWVQQKSEKVRDEMRNLFIEHVKDLSRSKEYYNFIHRN